MYATVSCSTHVDTAQDLQTMTTCIVIMACTAVYAVFSLGAGTGASHVEDDLDQLLVELTAVEDDIVELAYTEDQHELRIDGANERITILQGAACSDPWSDYRCRHEGRLSGRCLPSYMMCDGVSDCPEGDDEKYCDMVEEHLRPGVVLMIDVVVDTCSKYNLEATASTVEIVGFTKEPILNTTQIHILYTPSYNDGTSLAIPVSGIWYPASKAIYFGSAGGGGLDTYWKLDPLNKNAILGLNIRQLSREVCSYMSLLITPPVDGANSSDRSSSQHGMV